MTRKPLWKGTAWCLAAFVALLFLGIAYYLANQALAARKAKELQSFLVQDKRFTDVTVSVKSELRTIKIRATVASQSDWIQLQQELPEVAPRYRIGADVEWRFVNHSGCLTTVMTGAFVGSVGYHRWISVSLVLALGFAVLASLGMLVLSVASVVLEFGLMARALSRFRLVLLAVCPFLIIALGGIAWWHPPLDKGSTANAPYVWLMCFVATIVPVGFAIHSSLARECRLLSALVFVTAMPFILLEACVLMGIMTFSLAEFLPL